MNNARRLVFVGGIHGVGKTSFCKRLAFEMGLGHVSAGALIRQARSVTSIGRKEVLDVLVNQNALLETLDFHLDTHQSFLMDGHFCLLQEDRGVVSIANEVYQAINPAALVVVYDYPEAILDRLVARDGVDYSLSLLREMQDHEMRRAREVAKFTGVPLLEYDVSSSEDVLAGFIRGVFY